jgi:hypothetical protein
MTAPTSLAHGAARERGGERARWLAPTGGARLSGIGGARARAQAQAGSGPTRAKIGFLFPGIF